MTNQLRLGFIGGGINSAVGTTHMIAAQMDGLFRIDAACFSRDSDINQATARQWKMSSDRLYSSVESLLDNEKGKLDAVVILTPTPSHPELVIQALDKGYMVICEKALATTHMDAEAIASRSHQKGLPVFVTYNYTGYPMVRELRNMIRKGKLGKLQQFHIEMPQEAFEKLDIQGNPCTPQPWRLTDKDIPTISLDLGVHVVHMIGFLTGQTPQAVMGSQANFGNFEGIVDNVYAIAKYSDEMVSQLWYSKTALGHANGLRFRVYGEEGSAEWFQMEPEYLVLNDRLGRKSILTRASPEIEEANLERYNRFKAGHPAGFLEAFANHYHDIHKALSEYQATGRFTSPWAFSASNAAAGLKMLEAIHHSSETKHWVSLCP